VGTYDAETVIEMSTPAKTPERSLIELSREECLALLASQLIGRVVVNGTNREVPLIRPVSYLFDEPSQSVVFRTADGTKLYALLRSESACFETDAVDASSQTGWSVILLGRTEEVTEPTEVRRLEGAGLRTWAPGDRPHWIRIRARTVSGRRIEATGGA
jgi:uncharacterized protein